MIRMRARQAWHQTSLDAVTLKESKTAQDIDYGESNQMGLGT